MPAPIERSGPWPLDGRHRRSIGYVRYRRWVVCPEIQRSDGRNNRTSSGSCGRYQGIGKRQRHRERQELLVRVADAYSANYQSWAPTDGVASNLGLSAEEAAGLVEQAKALGIMATRRPGRA